MMTAISAFTFFDSLLGAIQKSADYNRDDTETAAWFNVFKGERVNEHHISVEEKRGPAANAARKGKS